MADLSPWQRMALDELATRPDVITSHGSRLRTGCIGLAKRGLAEKVGPFPGCYRITDEGRQEWLRRHRRDEAA
jgi:hypothetical protein